MNIIPIRERQTIPSTPPQALRPQRRSYWPSVLEEARLLQGQWVRTVKTFGRSTAQQLASDIRNSHRREPAKFRIRGVKPGEIWDAQWGRADVNAQDEECVVWIRLVSTTESRNNQVVKFTDEDIW